ncbi:MAG: holliday junction helicase RuvA [Clostridia bacterium]|jgi:Holliday junction DNA helicase RuvA|nr:Holliday junction ATP-dependent helicase RuvA [Clostridiales bacterium]MDK2986290.1 holliday junction helicase RuvA [Clostridia bacterium]
MIGLLIGNIISIESDYIILNVNGIGFQVYMTVNDIFKMSEQDNVTIYTHTHVREDVLQLFGFRSYTSLTLFKKLISVSGLGPKVALNILNSSSPDEIISAIVNENKEFLKGLPGIGAKSAAKLILELKDKLSNEKMNISSKNIEHDIVHNDAGSDAISALISLGYTSREAQEWVKNAVNNLTSPCDTSQIVSYVLKNLASQE